MITLGILGSNGKMGRLVAGLVRGEYSNRFCVKAAVDAGGDPAVLLKTAVVIDFSTPVASVAFAEAALAWPAGRLPAVVAGTTGWRPGDLDRFAELSTRTVVLVSSNFSAGVWAMAEMLRRAAPALLRLGYVPSMIERHHERKKDAPSGTALFLQRALYPSGEGMQIKSVRKGDIVGEHELTLAGAYDTLALVHHASDRAVFARGALEAALWCHARKHKNSGKLLSMDDFMQELIG